MSLFSLLLICNGIPNLYEKENAITKKLEPNSTMELSLLYTCITKGGLHKLRNENFEAR